MAKKEPVSHSPEKKPGKFERFWNQLFTYAYDCDNPQTLIVNEVFFIVAAIVFGWLCGLTIYLQNKVIVWIALVLLLIGELYFFISFSIGLTTFFLALVRRKRAEYRREHPTRPDSPSGSKSSAAPAEQKKREKRKYKISNRRF